ncbi:MAG: hypothetical protein H0V89_00120 [Deltaproteobacteria bacterium]|nr:hypothetical protein [Deltaproteobacteria bacterium]
MNVTTVHGCELVDGSVPVGTGDSGTADTAGTDAVYAEVACDVTGRFVCEGRHHACIERRTASPGDDLGAYFAGAWLSETTSVQAFLALAAELERLGAPETLVARARTSALDEIVHARLIAGFAAEQGATLGHAVFRRIPDRDPLSLAIENAVEGCVRETFAAFVASHQSCAAAPEYRAAYRVIAEDEVRHAELAWAIDGWLLSQLDLAGRQQVEAAREAAVQEIYDAVTPPSAGAAAAGLPSVEASHRLLDGLVLHLWSRLAA